MSWSAEAVLEPRRASTLAYQVVNLGCKVNRVESDAYETALRRAGFEEAPEGGADVVVVNTCTVTADAEKKTRKAVRRALRRNPEASVIVTGCSAAIGPDGYAQLDARVRVVPKSAMEEALASSIAALASADGAASAPLARARRGVKLQDGCDNACTFCIVHVARGRSVSRPADAVIGECRELLAAGLPEIMLTGINLGAWSRDGQDLTALLRRMLTELPLRDGDGRLRARLRLSSIEPQNVDDGLLDLIAASDGAICRHLHLPLQSGSSRVLHEMARRYSAEEYQETLSNIYVRMPEASISTDIIAGFPGETEADFVDSVALARAARFTKMHVFPYSLRTGTPAAARSDQVPQAVKEERAAALRALSDELRAADLARRAGSTELAAVETPGAATTESYHDVAVPADIPAGTLVPFTFCAADSPAAPPCCPPAVLRLSNASRML